jgi:hypothetical protein
MGIRKIRLCKSCGRKFTPRNQRSVEAEVDQNDVTSVVEPTDPIEAGIEKPELTEMQIPGQ